jgi:geranylgeranyl diphosphate synthase type II
VDIPSFFNLQAYSTSRIQQINAALDRLTPPADAPPASLHEAMRYSLFAGGKRVRPLMCVAAAESVGGTAEKVLPVACAIEMIHTFSLIHDDLPALDNDDLRRGMPTSHKVYGEALAILAGDALHTLAFSVLAGKQECDDPARLFRVIRLIAESCGEAGMVGGQVDDMLYERRPDITPEILRSIHARKTGALLNASILSGAILSGAAVDQEDALRNYGDQIGVAFQIIDDILDVTSDDATLGKPAGSDLKNDKATYPKLFGLEKSTQLAQDAVQTALSALSHFDERAEPLRAFASYIIQRDM